MKELKIFFRQVRTVAARDFYQLTVSPLFLVFMGISCIFLSYIFPRELFRFVASYNVPVFQQGAMAAKNVHFDVFVSHISYINLIFLFCIPILTMKLIAEERKNRTFDLLMTAPLSSLQIVVGKYIAVLGSLLVFLIISLLYPLSVSLFAEIPFGLLISSYIGVFMLTATYAAVGLFTSSLTSSLFLSVFIGVILNISLWFISAGQTYESPILTATMEYLSLSNHLTNFVKGSLVIHSFTFFFSCIIFFFF